MPRVQSTTAVRPQIKEMISPGSDEMFADSLPETTVTQGENSDEQAQPKVRRKRRTKEEIAAARGSSNAGGPPVDARLERAKAKASGLGGSAIISTGFTAAGKPLDSQEKEDLDDQFYLISCKAGIDPSGSWLFVILYTVVLLVRLVLSRTDLGEKLRELLSPKEEKEEPQQMERKEQLD